MKNIDTIKSLMNDVNPILNDLSQSLSEIVDYDNRYKIDGMDELIELYEIVETLYCETDSASSFLHYIDQE